MLRPIILALAVVTAGVALAAPLDEPAQSGEMLDAQMIPDDALPDLSGAPSRPEDVDEVEGPPPPILRDLSLLPPPVAETRARLIANAESGDLEALRSDLEAGDGGTVLSLGEMTDDPIVFLRNVSGDEEGYEILAILIEVLQAGFVHLDAGTVDEMFVWPYFVAYPLDELTPRQKIELYRILTAGDVEDSRNFGSYIFYRVGIRPDGTWAFFVAGD